MNKDKAFHEGVKAFKVRTNNPYKKGTKAKWWKKGFKCGKALSTLVA
jgi:hypothetical protein